MMMKYLWSGLMVFVFLTSCQNPDTKLQSKLEASKSKMEALEKELGRMGQTTGERKLVHLVYFNLKEDVSSKQILEFEGALKRLSDIKGVNNLGVGKPANTGDKRLISDYDYVLTMEFDSMDALKSYASDEFHMKIKKEVGPMLVKAPIVYDSWVE